MNRFSEGTTNKADTSFDCATLRSLEKRNSWVLLSPIVQSTLKRLRIELIAILRPSERFLELWTDSFKQLNFAFQECYSKIQLNFTSQYTLFPPTFVRVQLPDIFICTPPFEFSIILYFEHFYVFFLLIFLLISSSLFWHFVDSK